MRPLTVIGYLLWRGGLILAAGSALYLTYWWVLTAYDIPSTLKAGITFMAVGLSSVILSFILERRSDHRLEQGWRE